MKSLLWTIVGIIFFPLIMMSIVICMLYPMWVAWYQWFWMGRIREDADRHVIKSMRGGIISIDYKLR